MSSAAHADAHLGRNGVRRFEIERTDDSGVEQLVTGRGLAGERISKALRVQAFGDSSHAPAGAIGLTLNLLGRPDMPAIIGLEHPQHRPKSLAEGERCLYNAHGDKIFIYKEHVKVVTKTYEVVADDIVLNGNVRLGGPAGSGIQVGRCSGGCATKVWAV